MPATFTYHEVTLKRGDKFDLILETEATDDATSTAVDHPPGTVRMADERVVLRNIRCRKRPHWVKPLAAGIIDAEPKRILRARRANDRYL